MTKNSNPVFETLTVTNLIVKDDTYIPVNPVPKMLSSVSIFLNEVNNKFKVPFDCYISAISSCTNDKIFLEINSNKIEFEDVENIEYKLSKNDIIEISGLDTFLVLSFYERKRENSTDTTYLETEILNLKKILYLITGRELN